MSRHAPPRADLAGETYARIELTEGWSAVGVAPGSTDWRLEGLEQDLLALRVPGTAATALGAAGADVHGRDLDAEDWWFRCRFSASLPSADEETTLRLEGIATLADVWLNGQHLLTSDNMHVTHDIPVDGVLREENELVIGVRALAPLLTERRPRPRWRTRLVRDQGLRWFRTTLFGRIPAFAPGPAPVGPWRPVGLVTRRDVAVDDLRLRARVDAGDGVVTLSATLRPLGGFAPTAAHLVVQDAATELEIEHEAGRLVVAGSARVPGADLWWPHTHGEPALHDVRVVLSDGRRDVEVARERVGFRVLLAQDEPGLALSINGTPLFSRGGSLLPAALGIDWPSHELRALLRSVSDAGMNTIRLSGVGVYGSEELFRICDELGLLVWQDFAFANLDYPIADDDFRAAVEREADAFLARAGSHPSLAVLCGNSEVEQQVAMLGLDPALGRGPLFEELLPRLARRHDVDAHYVTSSPTGGELPFRPNAGVAHYFGVGAYRRGLEDVRRADVRFAAECLAFANVPGDDLLDDLAPGGAGRLVHHPSWKAGVPRDAGAGWDFDDVRDHYLGELFGVDPVELRSVDPERYLALSRVVTGEVMAATLGEWRRDGSTCRGALVWTLNDVLPGAGWGLLDDRGRPKTAYWLVRRALAPVAVWTTDEGTNGVAVHVANDGPEKLRGELRVALLRADGHAVEEGTLAVDLGARTGLTTSVEAILGRFVDAGHAYRFGPPAHELALVELHDGRSLRSRQAVLVHGLPATTRDAAEIALTATATPRPDGVIAVQVTAARLAYAVSVEAPGFEKSDDVFTVPPGRIHTVELRQATDDDGVGRVRLRPLNSTGAVTLTLERG